jgi:hypothetical protein
VAASVGPGLGCAGLRCDGFAGVTSGRLLAQGRPSVRLGRLPGKQLAHARPCAARLGSRAERRTQGALDVFLGDSTEPVVGRITRRVNRSGMPQVFGNKALVELCRAHYDCHNPVRVWLVASRGRLVAVASCCEILPDEELRDGMRYLARAAWGRAE